MARQAKQPQGKRLPKNKRDPAQAERDRELIVDMYLKGEPQHVIAKHFGLSQQQISYDLRKIKQRWRENQLRSFDEHIDEQLAKIDKAEQEYWKAWDATKGEEEIETTERGITPKGEIDKVSIRKRKTHGTPAYMDGILRCVEQRSKLLQLDLNAAMLAVIKAGYTVVNSATGEEINLDTPDTATAIEDTE